MVFSWIESKKELDLGLCVLDVRYNSKREAWIYSGKSEIIDRLIERNKIETQKHSIEMKFTSKRKFTFRERTFDGLWQDYKNKPNTYMFVSHTKMNAEGTKNPFPGVLINYRMLEDGICEMKIIVNNSIFVNIIRTLK